MIGVECSLDPAYNNVSAGFVGGQCECVCGVSGCMSLSDFGGDVIDISLGCFDAFVDIA